MQSRLYCVPCSCSCGDSGHVTFYYTVNRFYYTRLRGSRYQITSRTPGSTSLGSGSCLEPANSSSLHAPK